jgi:hypothetical protein
MLNVCNFAQANDPAFLQRNRVEKGARSFKLLYRAGWIMVTNDDDEIVRRVSLEDEDRKWLDDILRAQLPPKANVI